MIEEFDHAAFAQNNVNRFLSTADRPALSRSRKELQRIKDGGGPEKAKFATPEALATTIGASVVLGPIGGLLLGAANGLLGQREQQDANDLIYQEQEASRALDEEINSQENFLFSTARTREDREQVENFTYQNGIAKRLMESPYEDKRAQGIAMYGANQQAITQYLKANEDQLIKQDADEAAAVREMGQETYTRHRDNLNAFDKDTETFKLGRTKGLQALTLLDRGSASADQTAVKLVEQMVNTGTVLLSEQAAIREVGGLRERLAAIKQSLKDGKLPDPIRAEMKAIVLELDHIQNNEMLSIRDQFLERARDAGIDEKYWDNYDVPESLRDSYVKQAAAANKGANDNPEDTTLAGIAEDAALTVAATGLLAKDQFWDKLPGELKASILAISGASALKSGAIRGATGPAALFALPLLAGQQVEGESDEDYRNRLRRVMESTPYDEWRPTD